MKYNRKGQKEMAQNLKEINICNISCNWTLNNKHGINNRGAS